jgi:hypothetical protein
MDLFQRGRENLTKIEPGEQKNLDYKKTLLESGLLEKIEQRRLEIKKENVYKFDLYPCPTYDSMHSDHFLKEHSLLHTQYTVDHAGGYSSFCIEVKPDGIFLVASGKKPRKIDPRTITDQEIHHWFGLLVRR